ncbi:MAG: hypothetical protein WBW92_13055 [Rhodanobacteraceae bacterium]
MSTLRIYPDDQPDHLLLETSEGARMAAALSDIGVQFEQWAAVRPLRDDADEDHIREAYHEDIQRLMHDGGYQSMDVIRMTPEHPQRIELRHKFLDEHTHAEDEVRFFVAGSGLFSLHINQRVHDILCCKGDLIRVPAGIAHWFDMGDHPRFTAIRLFTNPDGWVARFTGSDISERFPRMPSSQHQAASP